MMRNTLIIVVILAICLSTGTGSGAIDNPKLIKLPIGFGPHRIENTPVIYQGRPLLIENSRLTNEVDPKHVIDMYIIDLTTNETICHFGKHFAFNCAYVNGDELNVFATECKDGNNAIYRFRTTDLKSWKKELALQGKKGEMFFNTSVCKIPDGYLMAYESNKPVQWCFRLARSKDLAKWERIKELIFADKAEGSVLANPTIRYIDPYYYAIIGIHRFNGKASYSYAYHRSDSRYFTFILRSKDLAMWDLSPTKYPMLEPEVEDGINATDADLFEFMGNTYIFYGAGWQDSRGTIRIKMYPGPMKECLESYFDDNTPSIKFDARNGKYIYPDQEEYKRIVSSTAAEKTKKIVFMGDSISCGSGASNLEKRYSTVLTGMLNAKGGKFQEVNLGISGSTFVDQFWPAPNSSGYPYVLERVIAENPDVFVIQHGTNDNALGHSLGRFLWTYRQAVKIVKEKLPRTTIVCMTICPSWETLNSTDEWLNQANAGIQEIAAMENTLLAQTYLKLGYNSNIFPDGIHPDDTGHQVMAESVFEALEKNEPKSINNSDLTFRTPGEYRMCGYSIRTKGEQAPSADKWVELYNFGRKEFEYTSYCELEIGTPLRYADKDFTVSIKAGDSVVKVKAQVNSWCGRANFTLPATNGKRTKVKIAL
jgi:acyl-CoA thioesterase-1